MHLDAAGRMRALVNVTPSGRARVGDLMFDGRGGLREVVAIFSGNDLATSSLHVWPRASELPAVSG
jgi:hypothetical protein